MTTHHHGDDHAPYYRIHKDATGETVAAPDHPATGRDRTSATTDGRDHDQADATSDQEETMATTRTAKSKTTTRPTRPATGRRGAEISIGLLLLTIGAGVGAYYLATGLLHWPRDIALVTSGLVAGLLASSILGPLWHQLRATVGGWIHPSKARQ